MEIVHALIGSLFTILITGSIGFIAYKIIAMATDISEIKDALKELQRGGSGVGSESNSAGKNFPAPIHDYQVSDDARPEREFKLPPPISRRLDAERGIKRESSDDFSLGTKSSERLR